MWTVGGTLLTASGKEVVAEAPWLSVAVMATVCDCSGPSVVANDQLQVPLGLAVTVPTEALRPTGFCPTSAKVPLFVPVCPSSTASAALVPASDGGRILTVTAIVLVAAWAP